MSLSALDAERDVMHQAKKRWDSGLAVPDPYYRYMLRRHAEGEHAGIKMNTCPECQFPDVF